MTPEQTKYLEEIMDPQKVQVYCGTHNYFGPSKPGGVEVKPAEGCPKCWFVLYFHDIATAPPETRAQRLDELEEVVNKSCELAARGNWDYVPYRHSQFETESN